MGKTGQSEDEKEKRRGEETGRRRAGKRERTAAGFLNCANAAKREPAHEGSKYCDKCAPPFHASESPGERGLWRWKDERRMRRRRSRTREKLAALFCASDSTNSSHGHPSPSPSVWSHSGHTLPHTLGASPHFFVTTLPQSGPVTSSLSRSRGDGGLWPSPIGDLPLSFRSFSNSHSSLYHCARKNIFISSSYFCFRTLSRDMSCRQSTRSLANSAPSTNLQALGNGSTFPSFRRFTSGRHLPAISSSISIFGLFLPAQSSHRPRLVAQTRTFCTTLDESLTQMVYLVYIQPSLTRYLFRTTRTRTSLL